MDSTTAAETTTTEAAAPGYALLIGVSDYGVYDPSGQANLPGSQHDVALLFWFCRTLLGLPADNIRILVSPTAPSSSLVDASLVPADGSVLPATAANIQEGIAWLSGNMKGRAVPGLLTYAGHGAWVAGKGSVICPADTASDLGNAISLLGLSTSPELLAIRATLTVLLDCCHVVAPPRGVSLTNRRVLSGLPPVGAKKSAGPESEEFNLSDCVYLAARPGRPAYQTLLGAELHGALTFALVAAAEQWSAAEGDGACGLDVANKTLVRCIRGVIRSLRIEQRAKLRLPRRGKKRRQIRARRFFGTEDAGTTARPDGEAIPMQIDGGWKYTYNVPGSLPSIAYLIATGTSTCAITLGTNPAYTAAAGKECWYVAPGHLTPGNLDQTMTVARTTAVGSSESVTTTYTGAGGSSSTSTPYVLTSESATWNLSTSSRPSTPTFTGTPYFYKYTPSSGAVIWMALDVSAFTVLGVTTYVLNQVVWYSISSSAPSGGTLNPNGSYPYQGQGTGSAPSTGTTYYWAVSKN